MARGFTEAPEAPLARRWLEFWRGHRRWKGGCGSGKVRLEVLDVVDTDFIVAGSPGVAGSDEMFAAFGD